MGYYAAGGVSTAGSTTLPLFGVVGAAGARGSIVELGITNTTATAASFALKRFSAAGTPGALITPSPLESEDPASLTTVRNTYTVTPTIGVDLGYRTLIPATIGAGTIWTFPGSGLTIPAVANAGIGLVVDTGTGQALSFYVVFEE